MGQLLNISKTVLGGKGETLAADLLRKNGYQILHRNIRSKFGEIDLVARNGKTLCFVEVKARSGLMFGFPEEGVSRQKQWRLSRLASWYLQRYRLLETPVRFDVVSILFDEKGTQARTRLIKGAFDGSI